MTVTITTSSSQSAREIEDSARIAEFQSFVESLDSGWSRVGWDTPAAPDTMVWLQLDHGNREIFELHALHSGGRISTGIKERSLSQAEWERVNAILASAAESNEAHR